MYSLRIYSVIVWKINKYYVTNRFSTLKTPKIFFLYRRKVQILPRIIFL